MALCKRPDREQIMPCCGMEDYFSVPGLNLVLSHMITDPPLDEL